MKSKLILIVTTFIFLAVGASFAVQPGKLPYGIQNLNDVSDSRLDSLRDILGFNLAYLCNYNGNVSRARIAHVDSLGFDAIPYMMSNDYTGITTAFQTYLNGHYIVTQAKDNSSQIRFLTQNGHIDPQNSDWYVAPKSDTPYVFLDNLWYDHERAYMNGVISYTPSIYMRIYPDTSIHSPSDTIAWLNIWASYPDWWSRSSYETVWGDSVRHGGAIYRKPIVDSMFSGSIPDSITFDPFQVPTYWIDTVSNTPLVLDTIYNPPPPFSTYQIPCGVLTYQIESAGRPCSLSVNWLKVYNNEGLAVMQGNYDNVFQSYAGTTNAAFLWQLRDDMRTDQMMLARHLEDIISTNSDKHAMMKFYEGFIVSPKDLVKVAHPKYFWIDRYLLFGGSRWDSCATGGPSTLYYGDQYYGNGVYGLQALFNQYVVDMGDSIRAAIGDSVKLYYIPQMQLSEFPNCPYSFHRRATGSELRMQIGMALCYKVDGIQFWPYDSESGPRGEWYYGLVNPNGNIYNDVWSEIENYATPTVQALDEYLVDPHMVWDKSYSSHQPDSFHYISEIHGWSDSFNPDSGWAQIGEFHNDSTGDKYILLVNRACSSDNNGTEAPPQHFVLKLNPNSVGSNYVLITDLADSLRHAGGDTGWVGISKTTYSATMPDGKIPYTITLKAGEGKLIKIAQ